MNQQIQALAEQAGLFDFVIESMGIDQEIQKFAELIVQECISACSTDQLGKTVGAEERIKQHFGIEE